jgi:hypothetical protein
MAASVKRLNGNSSLTTEMVKPDARTCPLLSNNGQNVAVPRLSA